MAKNEVREYAVTAAANTDIAGIGILGTNQVSNFDGALREEMAALGRLNSGAAPLNDTFSVCDPADITKKVRLDAGNVAAGQTRVLTMPNADVAISPFMAGVLASATAANAASAIGAVTTNGGQFTGNFSVLNNTPGYSLIEADTGTAWSTYVTANNLVFEGVGGSTSLRLTYGGGMLYNGFLVAVADGSTTYNLNISGNAATATSATTATNSTRLNNQLASFYQQALDALIPAPAAGRVHVVGKWAGSANLGYIAMDTTGNFISFTSF